MWWFVFHFATRFKSEEIKILAWESEQRAKLDGHVQEIEVPSIFHFSPFPEAVDHMWSLFQAKVERMRAEAQARILKKSAMVRQRSEEKKAKADARKRIEIEKTARQVEYIRRTGKVPSSRNICCVWFSS